MSQLVGARRRDQRRGNIVISIALAILILLVTESISQASSSSIKLAEPQQVNHQNDKIQPQQQQQQKPEKLLSEAANCTAACTSAEFASIIQRLNQNDDAISSLLQGKQSPSSGRNQKSLPSQQQDLPIRTECVVELIGLIKNLANDELEMKSVLEFASGSSPLPRGGAQLTSNRRHADNNHLLFGNSTTCKRTSQQSADQTSTSAAAVGQQDQLLIGVQDQEALSTADATRSKVLPKVVAKVDHYIDSLERFTLTREWSSVMRVFQGVESIMSLFVPSAQKSTNSTTIGAKINKTIELATAQSGNYGRRLETTTTTTTVAPKVNLTAALSNQAPAKVISLTNKQQGDEILANLKAQLPQEVQTLTTSLGNLFPWHVWPWNNADLYATAETFLNHGVFAFSKTTSGPERRIDYLADMLQSLFKSLKFDTFPKKCADWSKVICDPEKFYDRLVAGPSGDSTTSDTMASSTKDSWKIDNSKGKNLTGELTCIMFSSLSMKQFGASAKDLQGQDEAATWASLSASRSLASQRLAWDRLVHKALKLYSLAREALTDDQWASLHKLLNDLWLQQKISDRVIMVGRVVQLLTSCHMPKEMLESALWKDIYKYKNALNQMSDILIEELNRSAESGKFEVDQLALKSKNLNEILTRTFRLLPKLIESLSKTIVDQLPDLVNKFFSDKLAFYQGPCKGSSFSDLIPNLDAHRVEIMELEDLICAQLNTKPNFSMMQINNLTNELLAMAFNFSNFGNAFALPEFFSQFSPIPLTSNGGDVGQTSNSTSSPTNQTSQLPPNVTSIVDELVANPRLAAIVAILQSSPLDPPEVHAELPELDWVEASTSVALFYESIQRLMSFEGQFVIFPEVDKFQETLMSSVDKSRQLFVRFSKRDPIRLFAYALDAVMPVALRTFKPTESFYFECQATLRDLFSQVPDVGSQGAASSSGEIDSSQPQVSRESRQWQCFVSSLNFGAHALNKLIANFNSMLENVLAQASFLATFGDAAAPSEHHATGNSLSNRSTEASCLLFDGSLARLLDNWPQVMELALESVLVTSTQGQAQPIEGTNSTSGQHVATLYETICNTNYSLDPFSATRFEDIKSTRVAMCRLANKTTLTNCANVLKFDDWKATMRQLNATWFESNAVSVEPAFRATTKRVHEFLVLFGRAKPNNWSESLLARILNVNSFWDSLLNKTVNTLERYQERKFELGLQALEPIVYDNLLTALPGGESEEQTSQSNATTSQQTPSDILVTSIGVAKVLLNHFNATRKQQVSKDISTVEGKMAKLFNLVDDHALVMAETLLRTIATNSTQLELLFTDESSTSANVTDFWSRFCQASVARYLNLEQEVTETTTPNVTTTTNNLQEQLQLAQREICQFQWIIFRQQLVASVAGKLRGYPSKQLTRVALTKWGQTLDSLMSNPSGIAKFLQMSYWQSFSTKLSLITPLKDQPSNFIWIWEGFERLIQASEAHQSKQQQQPMKVSDALTRAFEQLNCALDSVKGGLSWDNLANIYSDRQEILAAHSTINNGFVLASIGVSTFMAPKKFQRLLDEFVRPIQFKSAITLNGPAASATSVNSTATSSPGASTFCETRDKSKWESILSLPNEAVDFSGAIESFQELVCDTNFDTLPQSINPISVCYQISSPASGNSSTSGYPLAETIDRAFKLASLAIMDSKLVAANDARPPILDKSQWASFWDWWSTQPAAEPRGGLALALVRVFQTLDSMNSGHVVWRAIFKSVHELSEALAFLVRAAEQQQQVAAPLATNSQVAVTKQQQQARNSTLNAAARATHIQSQHLMSTVSSLIFPEANNLIPLKTFKQLRYIKSIADYFTQTPGAQESICAAQVAANVTNLEATRRKRDEMESRVELIGFKLNTNGKLNLLLCHYHSSQWLTALNIVIAAKTSSLTKRVNYMTKYLSTFTRQYKDHEQLESFVHARQMDNIEQVSNATISHLLVASYSLRGSMSLAKLSNVSWSSLPSILNTLDKQLCDTSQAEFGLHNFKQLINYYSPPPGNPLTASGSNMSANFNLSSILPPQLQTQLTSLMKELNLKKPGNLETLICKLPKYNVSQIFKYLSENFDLQKMISLVTYPMQLIQQQLQQQQQQPTLATGKANSFTLGSSSNSSNNNSSLASVEFPLANQTKVCVTPFKLAAKWIEMAQDTYAQLKSKSSRDKIRKCLTKTGGSGAKKSGSSSSICEQSLKYMKYLNKLLASINQLTSDNSWHKVRKTWGSISFHLINTNATATRATGSQLARQLPALMKLT